MRAGNAVRRGARATRRTADFLTGGVVSEGYFAARRAIGLWLGTALIGLVTWLLALNAAGFWTVGFGLLLIACVGQLLAHWGKRGFRAMGRAFTQPVVAIVVGIFGVALPLVQTWALPTIEKVNAQAAGFLHPSPSSALLIVAVYLLTPASAAIHWRLGSGRRQAIADAYAGRLAQVFAVPERVWRESAGVAVAKDGTISVNPVPAAALMGIGDPRVEVRLSALLPDLELAEGSGPAGIILEPVSEATRARRAAVEFSDGLVVGVEDTTSSPARPEARVWVLADDVGPSAAPRVAELADRHDQVLVAWQPHAHRAVVARLPAERRALRDRMAGLLGVQPWDIELLVKLDGEPHARYVSEIEVIRLPELLDPGKRRQVWTQAAKSALPPVPGTVWRFEDRPADGRLTIRRVRDPLAAKLDIADFLARFPNTAADPAESWRSFPIAMTEDGAPVNYQVFHTLGVGQTGAGKGSIWWSIFAGLLPAARAGLVEFYAIDPKGAEAIGGDGQPLGIFEEVASNADDWAALLDRLVADMDRRKGQGRTIPVTREQPLRLILIDELSALSKLDVDNQRAKSVMANLLTIASQGRSLNTLLVGLVQAPQKEMVGDLRDFMPMRLALRTATKTETDLVLGDGATDMGAEAHLIPVAAPGNGYASAGIGFMRVEGDPEPARVRLPYTSDEQIEEWSAEVRQLRGARSAAPSPQDVTVGDFEFVLDDDEAPAFSLDDLAPEPIL